MHTFQSFKLRVLSLGTAAIVLGFFSTIPSTQGAISSAASAPAALTTANLVKASEAFLKLLSDEERQKVLFAFNDNTQRARWSNFPTGVVARAGLRMQDLNESQRAAVLAILRSVLSETGYQKVQDIRDADEAYKVGPRTGPGGGRRGAGPGGEGRQGSPRGGPGDGPDGGRRGGGNGGDDELFGKDLYYISFLGTPSQTDPWMLQFGGHHLALNLTIRGERGVLTPSLTAAQPTSFQRNGENVRTLGRENDKGFVLVNALNESQRKQAILNYRVQDLVLGPGHDGETIQPEGLKASEMNATQREMLLDLISEWAGIVTNGFAAERVAELRADLDSTWFAWSGPTEIEAGKNGVSYYRIQGPKLVIEYAPQGGDDHVHTMYRDPTNDYGAALTKKP